MREMKCLAHRMGVKVVMFPDTSDVLDAPQTGKHEFYPKGGATVEQIRSAGDSIGTLGLGNSASTRAANALEEKCDVPRERLELPIGLQATDRFIEAMRTMAGVKVPDVITDERGRLLDMMADMHQYFYGKRVALFGDPDQLASLAEFLVCLDMKPVYIVTGTPSTRIRKADSEVFWIVPFRERKFARGPQADIYPVAPMDQAGAGRSADRQYLRQIHRARRKHSLRASRLSHSRPRGTLIFPDRRIRRSYAVDGKDSWRADGSAGP